MIVALWSVRYHGDVAASPCALSAWGRNYLSIPKTDSATVSFEGAADCSKAALDPLNRSSEGWTESVNTAPSARMSLALKYVLLKREDIAQEKMED